MLAAQIGHLNPGLVLLQDDDLLFLKTTALHALVLVLGQSELRTGLRPGVRSNSCSSSEALRGSFSHALPSESLRI